MPISGRPASPAKADIIRHKGKGAKTILPNKGALFDLSKGAKNINTYAKAGPTIAENGPDIVEPQ